MNSEQRAWQFREYREADIPAMVEIFNLEYPDGPTTIDQERYWEYSYPKDNPRLRLALEERENRLIDVGWCEKPFWTNAPGTYAAYELVHPDWRRRGIGRSLLAQFELYAARQTAEKLWSQSREDQPDSTRFLQAAGFRQFGIRFEQEVDLEQFDFARLPDAVERIQAEGYCILTLADLRARNPDADWLLYAVVSQTGLEVPLPGGAQIKLDFEQWRKELASPDCDPACIFLALRGEDVVGETILGLPESGPAITHSTGVLREHRGRGIAMAIKLASLQALKDRGYKAARTHNDTANPAILHLNEKIGYRRLPGWLQWEKRLG